MPRSSGGASVLDVEDRRVEDLHREVRVGILKALNRLDWKNPETLSWTIRQFIKAHIEAKNLSELLVISRAAISRWSRGQTLPPSPIYRESLINILYAYLDETIATGRESERPMPPRGRVHVAHRRNG
jgi:hypothetical protein